MQCSNILLSGHSRTYSYVTFMTFLWHSALAECSVDKKHEISERWVRMVHSQTGPHSQVFLATFTDRTHRERKIGWEGLKIASVYGPNPFLGKIIPDSALAQIMSKQPERQLSIAFCHLDYPSEQKWVPENSRTLQVIAFLALLSWQLFCLCATPFTLQFLLYRNPTVHFQGGLL